MTREFTRLKTLHLRGKLFRLIWKKPKDHKDKRADLVGKCESPNDKGKELWIDPKQDPEELFWTMLHEVTHGCFWDLEETAVEEFERDARRFAKRVGFKITL